MSTRATYQFKSDRNSGTPGACIYVHHDGYSEGAAEYFALMLAHSNKRGGMACQFLRANEGAELTGSHESHGDTEYRYTVTADPAGAVLKQEHRSHGWGDDVREVWTLEYSGPVVAFVERFSTHRFLRIPRAYSSHVEIVTAEQAKAQLNDKYRLLGMWTRKEPLSLEHGNASGVRSEIAALEKALAEFMAQPESAT